MTFLPVAVPSKNRKIVSRALAYISKTQIGFCSLAAVIGVFLFITSFHSLYETSKSKLGHALLSQSYRDSLIVSLAVDIPIAIDLLIDLLTARKNLSSLGGYFAGAICVVSTLASSSVLIYLQTQNLINSEVYWPLVHLEMLGIGSSALSFLNVLCEEFWTTKKTVITVILFGISAILCSTHPYISTFKTNYGIASFTFLILSHLYFTFHVYKWYTSSLDFEKLKLMHPNLLCSIFYMIIIQVGYISIYLLYFCSHDQLVEDMSSAVATAIQYGLIGAVILMETVHHRGMRLVTLSVNESLEMKRKVVRYVSHEIRNPVNTISLGLGLLHKHLAHVLGEIPLSIGELLDEMLHASLSTERILDDLILYEKLQEKETNVKSRFCSLKIWDFAKDCAKFVARQANQKETKIIFEEREGHGMRDIYEKSRIKADVNKLQQVITTLLTNAIKVSPRGSTVTVRGDLKLADDFTRRRLRNGTLTYRSSTHVFRLEVTDMGEEVMQSFSQVAEFDVGVLQGGQGTSLGLWICKRIIDLHQGTVGVEASDTGVGSTFFVEIPILPEPSSVRRILSSMVDRQDQVFARVVDQVIYMQRSKQGNSGTATVIESNGISRKIGSKKVLITKSRKDLGVIHISDSKDDNLHLDDVRQIEGDKCTPTSPVIRPHLNTHTIRPKSTKGLWSRIEIRVDVDSQEKEEHPQQQPGSAPLKDTFKESQPPIREGDGKWSPTGTSPSIKTLSYPKGLRNPPHKPAASRTLIPRRCLVVDDVGSNRKMLIRILADEFDIFDQATDGAVAVSRYKGSVDDGKEYHMILMDYVMPNMDGPTATNIIRNMGYKGPIFGVTGNAQQRDIEEFTASGCDMVFTKPIDVVNLKATIVRSLVESQTVEMTSDALVMNT